MDIIPLIQVATQGVCQSHLVNCLQSLFVKGKVTHSMWNGCRKANLTQHAPCCWYLNFVRPAVVERVVLTFCASECDDELKLRCVYELLSGRSSMKKCLF